MAVDAYVHHHVPGRLRIRVPEAKGDEERLNELSTAIAQAPGVSAVEYNPITGSILIQYSPEQHGSLDSLHAGMNASAVPIVVSQAPVRERHDGRHRGRSVAATKVDAFFRQLDNQIRGATDNQFDLKFIMPVAVGVLGLFSLRHASATPLWLTLMIFAFHSFLGLHSSEEIGVVESLALELDS
jgi:hypothetical protein